jgi:DinB superfamily
MAQKKSRTKSKPKTQAKAKRNGGAKSAGVQVVREELIALLKGGNAHVHFADVVEAFPERQRGAFAPGFKHTAWQLLEHARIAQWDILEFSRNAKHVSPNFPGGYWPKTPGPPTDDAWTESWSQFQNDLNEMISLVKNPKTDLCAKIPHGGGQNILREALVLADHNSYHLAQLLDLRRAFGTWPEQ